MYSLEGVSCVANFITAYESFNKTETPIFYLECVLCFQWQPFEFLFYLQSEF